MIVLAQRIGQKLRDLARGHAFHRSPLWPHLRSHHIALHPTCAACGSSVRVEVHHIVAVHHDPSRELDLANLITLCSGPARHHYRLGHLSNWDLDNPHVREHAAAVAASLAAQKALDTPPAQA